MNLYHVRRANFKEPLLVKATNPLSAAIIAETVYREGGIKGRITLRVYALTQPQDGRMGYVYEPFQTPIKFASPFENEVIEAA
jgi:hypothetical protein